MKIVFQRRSLLFLVPLLLASCSTERSSFLDPAGPIAAAQRAHFFEVLILTMIAILPVFILVPLILWRYRYRNKNARYLPDWSFSGWLDLAMWGVPLIIVTVLSTQLWQSTHELDPYKPIDSPQPPVNVQVVGLDWKWLFIYPDLGIATVNELAFPIGSSVAMDITTDTVMQSIMIPALAGQIYAMPGMRTKLHVLADEPGTFLGENTQFNGVGFTEQKFDAVAMIQQDFEDWVAMVRATGVPLDDVSYGRLAVPSTGSQAQLTLGTPQMPSGVVYFSEVTPGFFAEVLNRYSQGTAIPPSAQPGAVGYIPPGAPNGAEQ